jgi:ComF family protein
MLTEIKERFWDIFFPPIMVEKVLRKISLEKVFHKCQKTLGLNNSEIISVFSYKDPFIRDSIIETKTNRNKHALNLYAQILHQEINYYLEENLINPDYKIILTYIPQYKDTYLDKGFNQTRELALEIAKLNENFEVVECLQKNKKTIPQRETINRKQRLKNIKGSFVAINIEKFENKTVILIDDVVTTGATLSEGKSVLLDNKARSVICFTVAH